MSQTKRTLQAISDWAKTVPFNIWIAGPPLDYKRMVAVRTATGRILTGHTRAFCQENIRRIESMPKYGKVVAHLLAGE